MFDNWDAIFGDEDTLSKDALTKALKKADVELVDLKTGEYVGKDKFEAQEKKRKREIGDLEAKVTDLTEKLEAAESKPDDGDGDETAKALEKANEQIAELTKRLDDSDGEKTRLEREAAVAKKVSNPDFQRLAYLDAVDGMDDDTDFDAALAAVIEAKPHYAEDTEPPSDGPTFKTGERTKGKPPATEKLAEAFAKGALGDEAGDITASDD